jgi:DNA-binding transcriptional LysR family regulator
VILEGIGYGWLPEYLIKAELRRGELKTIVSEIANEHRFMPRLYHKPLKSLGKSGRLLLEGLRQGV